MVKIRICRDSAMAPSVIPAVAMSDTFNSNASGRFWKDKSMQPARAKTKDSSGVKKKKAYERSQKLKEKRLAIKDLTQQLKADIEAQSNRARAERKKAKERRMENEKSSMVIQRISRVKAMKKLSPHARRRLGIYAQHELNESLMK